MRTGSVASHGFSKATSGMRERTTSSRASWPSCAQHEHGQAHEHLRDGADAEQGRAGGVASRGHVGLARSGRESDPLARDDGVPRGRGLRLRQDLADLCLELLPRARDDLLHPPVVGRARPRSRSQENADHDSARSLLHPHLRSPGSRAHASRRIVAAPGSAHSPQGHWRTHQGVERGALGRITSRSEEVTCRGCQRTHHKGIPRTSVTLRRGGCPGRIASAPEEEATKRGHQRLTTKALKNGSLCLCGEG